MPLRLIDAGEEYVPAITSTTDPAGTEVGIVQRGAAIEPFPPLLESLQVTVLFT